MRSILRNQNRDLFELWRETGLCKFVRELMLDVSTEKLLSAARGFTYTDLYGVLGGRETVAWLTPHAAIMPAHGSAVVYCYQLELSCRFYFSADGKDIVALARSPEHLLEISDVVIRLLAASDVHSVILRRWGFGDGAFINAATLAYLMEQCQSLSFLSLCGLALNEHHCRVLDTYSRPGVEIELKGCELTNAGASALAEVLGRNRGPTKLDCFDNYSILANGLRGNSRLKSLREFIDTYISHDAGNRQVLAIAGALKENKGLVELEFCYDDELFSEKAWYAICDSLETHPTLQVLNVQCWDTLQGGPLAPAVDTSWILALLYMLKVNTSLHTIHWNSHDIQHKLFRESVIPYLETNRLRPRVLAIQKTRPIAYRTKVLGRALLAARTDPNRFWMLLSGNAEIAFSSTTATTTAAANFPTLATATTPVNAAPVVAIAAVTATNTPAASAASAWCLFCGW
jgi:hypothetical protein